MSLQVPDLDDRRFQDLVDEAKRRVKQACPEWTDHNVSDPGVTLIELFAWMTEQVIYRLNQVPDRLYLKFLELIGVQPEPPRPARADVTFWLSAAQPVPLEIPEGSVVATLRTGPEAPVAFTVTRAVTIAPCALARVVLSRGGRTGVDEAAELDRGEPLAVFSDVPAVDDSLVLELTAAVPSCAVTLRFDCEDAYGERIDPRRPPFTWEASGGGAWLACDWEDGTHGLNVSGDLVVHVPRACGDDVATRLRCRIVDAPGRTAYRASPRVRAIDAATTGATTSALQAELVRNEDLGTSDGLPSQRFVLRHAPVASGEEPLIVESQEADGVVEYTEVRHLAATGPEDAHFSLERSSGELLFGLAVREAGSSRPRLHGRIPPAGSRLVARRYLAGGGPAGNVAAGALAVLKTTIPTVARVTNRRPGTGGVAGETVEEARARGALELRVLERAVTPEDYERLARAASAGVQRVRCLPPAADSPYAPARVLLVPRVSAAPEALTAQDMHVPASVAQRVRDELESRRVLGARFVVDEPRYVAVRVNALVRLLPTADADAVERDAVAALYRWFHPTLGGPDGRGWPFGRAVYSGEAYVVLQRVRGIEIVQDLRLFAATDGGEEQPVQRVPVAKDALVISRGHAVAATEAG